MPGVRVEFALLFSVQVGVELHCQPYVRAQACPSLEGPPKGKRVGLRSAVHDHGCFFRIP